MKKTTKLLFALAALLSLAIPARADVNTAYSMFGYGILGDRATSIQRQMGGVGYAMQSGRQINAMNPASYACIDSLTFLWDMGADVAMLWSKEGSDRNRTTGGGLNYLAMQFPLSKYMGMSVGMVPVSQVGYSFGSDIQHGTRINQGSGGINQAYAGVSGRFAGISLGLNIAYDFGTIQHDTYATPDSQERSIFENIMEVRDWSILAGIQYEHNINRYNSVTVGATYAPKKSYHGQTWVTKQVATSQATPDTVVYTSLKGKYFSPQTVGFGVSYKYEKRKRIVVEADITWQQWSKAKFSALYDAENPERLVLQGMTFNNRTKLAIGGEYTHNVLGSWLERMPVRAGAFYTKDYLKIPRYDSVGNIINEYGVKEYGVTCGLGINAPASKTQINLGFEWRHRGTGQKNLLSENYFNVMLGINFNEVWFWKRRIK